MLFLFVLPVVFLVGLAVGSFVNVLIYRLPLGLSLWGRSFCHGCKKQISWFDNIPVLSFIFLKGRCGSCNVKISFLYPLVEVTIALLFAVSYYLLPTATFIRLAFVTPILFAVFVIDAKYQIIPDSLIFWGILLTFFLPNPYPLISNLFAGLLAASFLLVLYLVTGGKGMGLGDVKLAVLGGMLCGIKLVALWLFIAFLTGAIVAIILIVWKKKKLKDKIAFGPFLVAAIPLLFLFRSIYELF